MSYLKQSPKLFTVLLVIFALLLIAMPAKAKSNQTHVENSSSYSYVQDDEGILVRRRLEREIRSELLQLAWYGVFDWLQFEVNAKREVTISGQVTRPSLKSGAESVVKDIDGVRSVNNQIEVLPTSPNDDRLRIALYREIYSGPLFRYSTGALNAIHIIVKNGRATLKGIVDSEGDKNIAGIRAKGVSGVFEVNNELIVQNRKE